LKRNIDIFLQNKELVTICPKTKKLWVWNVVKISPKKAISWKFGQNVFFLITKFVTKCSFSNFWRFDISEIILKKILQILQFFSFTKSNLWYNIHFLMFEVKILLKLYIYIPLSLFKTWQFFFFRKKNLWQNIPF